jgi:hypothetical protein
MNIVAFEALNDVRIEVRMSVGDRNGEADVRLVALAHNRNLPVGEAPPLASASLSCSGSRLLTMDAALIHLMYMLDGQLAFDALR